MSAANWASVVALLISAGNIAFVFVWAVRREISRKRREEIERINLDWVERTRELRRRVGELS